MLAWKWGHAPEDTRMPRSTLRFLDVVVVGDPQQKLYLPLESWWGVNPKSETSRHVIINYLIYFVSANLFGHKGKVILTTSFRRVTWVPHSVDTFKMRRKFNFPTTTIYLFVFCWLHAGEKQKTDTSQVRNNLKNKQLDGAIGRLCQLPHCIDSCSCGGIKITSIIDLIRDVCAWDKCPGIQWYCCSIYISLQ